MNDQENPGKKLAIFDAALDLISRNGFHESPTSKIAAEAGVGIGTIYRYFESKDDLINQLFKYIENKMVATILEDGQPGASIREQFVHYCRKYIRFAADNPKASSYFEQYVDSPYGSAMRREHFYGQGERLSERILPYPFYPLFTAAKEQGIVKDLPNSILFVVINGIITHFIRDIRIGFINCNEEMVNTIITACWDAVKR